MLTIAQLIVQPHSGFKNIFIKLYDVDGHSVASGSEKKVSSEQVNHGNFWCNLLGVKGAVIYNLHNFYNLQAGKVAQPVYLSIAYF